MPNSAALKEQFVSDQVKKIQALVKKMKCVDTNLDTKHDECVWSHLNHSTVTSSKLAHAAESVETENIHSMADFSALKKKFHTNQVELEQLIKKIFISCWTSAYNSHSTWGMCSAPLQTAT